MDDETGVLSHEFDESITDPDGGGGWWDDSTGNEIGDVCNGTDAAVNWTAADHAYAVQTEYSTVSDACLGGGPFGDNRLTLSAVSGAGGAGITISGTGFNDAGGTLLAWKFTDSAGTVSTSVGTPPTADVTGAFGATAFTIPAGAVAGRGTIEVVGLTPDDAAAADFTVGPVTRKPDSLIGKAGIGPWTGNNHYNTTGAGQSLTMNVKRGKSYTFWAQIQNDGNVSDTFSVKGIKAPAGFTITYMVGTSNVTAVVESGAYHPVLAAGSAFIMQIKITVKASTPVNKKFKDVILATSLVGATKDAVVETVTAK